MLLLLLLAQLHQQPQQYLQLLAMSMMKLWVNNCSHNGGEILNDNSTGVSGCENSSNMWGAFTKIFTKKWVSSGFFMTEFVFNKIKWVFFLERVQLSWWIFKVLFEWKQTKIWSSLALGPITKEEATALEKLSTPGSYQERHGHDQRSRGRWNRSMSRSRGMRSRSNRRSRSRERRRSDGYSSDRRYVE